MSVMFDLVNRGDALTYKFCWPVPHPSIEKAKSTENKGDVEQGVIFREDVERCIHELGHDTRYDLARLAMSIARAVVAPFTLFVEIYRLCGGEIAGLGKIGGLECLYNIFASMPYHFGYALLEIVFRVVKIAYRVLSTPIIAVGFLVWHGGERVVRHFTGASFTVLSNNPEFRSIVYESLGFTLVAAAALLIPVTSIQLMAIPIILGSIYGILNNQFTVRRCPEYYTMGHHYDGTDLKDHAVKTNNKFIKPIVTGCYATTFVTKIAGLILAGVGTLPFAAVALSLPLAAAMVGGICIIALVAGHILSKRKEKILESALQEFAQLHSFMWNDPVPEDPHGRLWEDLSWSRAFSICLNLECQDENRRDVLHKLIRGHVNDQKLPVKYMTGWTANSTRNGVGYLFAGGGTLALVIVTICLRVLVL